MTALKRCIPMIISVGLLVAGCQATPDEEVVVGKADDTLHDIIYVSPMRSEAYVVPDDWRETLTFGDMTVNICADIEAPQTDAFPIVKAVPDTFDNDDAQMLAEVLMPGAALYKPKTQLTKPEIGSEIVILQSQLTGGDLYQVRDQYPERWDDYVKGIEQAIDALEQQYETASDTYEQQPAVLEFVPDTEDMDTEGLAQEDVPASNRRYVIRVEADLGGEEPATFQMWRYDDDNRNIACFINQMEGIIGDDISSNTDNLRGVELSLREAEDIAKAAISDLGLDMDITAKGSVIVEDRSLRDQGIKYNDMPQCYVFYFTRNIGGIQTTYETQSVGARAEDMYAEPWQYESIEVCVNDSGIIELYWVSPTQITETVNENAALLSFDKIQDIFREQIGINSAYADIGYADESVSVDRTMDITRITLGMMRIREKDTGDYLYIPVWDFFGSYTDKYPDDYEDTMGLGLDESNEITLDGFAHSFLTINAMDGSLIDRGLGY